MFFSKRDSNNDLALIISLDGFSVEAGLLKYKDEKFFKTAEILDRENLIQNTLNFIPKNIEERLERILKRLFEKTAKNTKCRINFCLFSVSSPWYFSKTHFIKIQKNEPFIVNKEEFDKILKNEDSRSEE